MPPRLSHAATLPTHEGMPGAITGAGSATTAATAAAEAPNPSVAVDALDGDAHGLSATGLTVSARQQPPGPQAGSPPPPLGSAGPPMDPQAAGRALPSNGLAHSIASSWSGGAAWASLPKLVLTLSAMALVVLLLVLGEPILMPLAMAALLSFILGPLVNLARRWRLPQGAAVGLVMVATLAVLVGLSSLLWSQISELGRGLPAYQTTIENKLRALRFSMRDKPSVIRDVARVVGAVEVELDATRKALEEGAQTPKAKIQREPTRVVVETPQPTAWESLKDTVMPLVLPVANAGFVLVLAAFFLLQRQEMRDRLVRLIGGDVHQMSEALDEAGERVSRYLGAQVVVNVGYGIPMALGLWWIGVPGAWLWGTLAAVLRFVPYAGPMLGAVFPLVMAFAVDAGWSMVLWTLGLVLLLELISNNVVEPIAYGAKTGVSSIAIVVSAAFWALVWGPVGLILATPLTVCLVVLGRYVQPLRGLDVLLSSESAFDRPTQLYQRLLSGNLEDARDIARRAVQEDSLAGLYSDVMVPMLTSAAREGSAYANPLQRHRVNTGVSELLKELTHRYRPHAAATRTHHRQVACVGARTELDTLSAEMLAHLLATEGVAAFAVPAVEVTAARLHELDLAHVSHLVLCTHSANPQVHTRFVVRRLRRRWPGLRIVLAAWSPPTDVLQPKALKALEADAVAASLAEAAARVREEFEAIPATQRPSGDAAVETPAPAPASERQAAMQHSVARSAQQVQEVFGVALATVAWRRAEGQWVEYGAGPSTWTLDPGHTTLEPGSPPEWVAREGEPLVVPDVAREPRFAGRHSLRLDGLVFFAGTPIRGADGQVVGVLALHDASARQFSDDELALLDDMAGQIAERLRHA